MSYKNFEVGAVILVVIVIGVFFNSLIKIDYKKETTEMISCPFELDFLTSPGTGFHDKQECIDLNTALHSQHLNECLDKLTLTPNTKSNEHFLDRCVYHSVSIDFLVLQQQYISWRDK